MDATEVMLRYEVKIFCKINVMRTETNTTLKTNKALIRYSFPCVLENVFIKK